MSFASKHFNSLWRASSALPKRTSAALVVARAASGTSSGGEGSSSGKGFGTPKKAPAEALQSSLADISQSSGRTAQTNNLILGASESEDKWRQLDEQVNEYPGTRTFKAIGDGGDSFVASMVSAVESVTGTALHEECISTRLSAKQNYISVTLEGVWVETPDQVLAIYEKMRADPRMRFFF
eukprot:scaffold2.g7515.t1